MSSIAPSLKEPGSRVRWKALVALFLGPAFVFANMYTTQAILPVLGHDYQIDAPTAGLSVSIIVLCVAIGSLFYGPLSDRIGRKTVMVGTSLLVAIPTFFCGLAPTFTLLLCLRALQGLLMPGLTGVAISYVNDEFEGRERGLAMGIYVSGLTLGGLFARTGSAFLTSISTWHLALLAFTLPTLFAALAMWRFLPDSARQRLVTTSPVARLESSKAGARNVIQQALHDMWLHLHNRRLVGAFIIGFSLFFGFIGIFTYLPYYLSGPHFKLPTIQLGLVYLLWLLGVFSPVAGSVAGRVGTRRSIAVTMSLAACGLLVTLVPALPVVIIGLGMLALGMFCTIPAVNLYLGEQARVAKGTAASMYFSFYYFGGSLGAVLPGIGLVWAGWAGVALICLLMIFIAICADLLLCR